MKDFGWFDKLLTISGTYLPSTRKDVKDIMAAYDLEHGGIRPKKYRAYDVSSRLIKKAALKTGGMGGLTCVPAALPVVGTLGTVALGSAVDLYYLMRTQIELCYAVSVAYEVEMDEEELKAITLAILGFSGSAETLKALTSGVLRRSIDEIASGYLKTGLSKASYEVMERLVPQFLKRTYKLIPFLGIPLGASINIASTLIVGNQARRYFSIWADSELLGDITEEHLLRLPGAVEES